MRIPVGIAKFASRIPAMLEEAARALRRLPESVRNLVVRMMDHLKELDRRYRQ